MKKKNTLPIKWMLGILIILAAAAYWMTQQMQSKTQGILPTASNISLQNNFFQSLANLIGIPTQGESSSEGSKKNNITNQNELMPTQKLPTAGHIQNRITKNVSPVTIPSEIGLNAQAAQGAKPIAEQETNAAQQGNNAENNQGNNSGPNADQEPGNLNSGVSADHNPWNLAGNNAEMNAKNNPGSNPGDYSGCVLGCYPGCNPGCDPECNPSVCNLGNIPGNTSGNTSENTSGNNSGTNAYQVPGNLISGIINRYNLPTINPIPSDNAVSQSIAQQNQQSDTLSALIAARQALVVPVQQQAQASKYQTVNSQNIPASSTDQAPADAVAKMKSNKVMYH